MSVKYSWNRQNGAAMPSVQFMSIEPAENYYKGMPLKLKEKGIVEPTDGDPEYICMAQYNPGAEIQPLEIPVQEVFPDVVYDRMNDDGTIEEVRFGSNGGGVSSWNDLTDKPFYENVTEKTVGSEIIETITADLGGGEGTYYQLSTDILQISDVIGKTVKYNIEGLSSGIDEENKEIVITQDMIMDMSGYGLPMFTVQDTEAGNAIFMVVSGDLSALGVPFAEGVWANDYKGEPTVTEFIYNITTIKKLDSKFIEQVCGETDHVLFSAKDAEFHSDPNNVLNNGKSAVVYDIPKLPLTAGREYTVSWDSVEYKCVAVSPMNGIILLGNNEYIMGTGNNGMPFCYNYADLRHMGIPGIVFYLLDIEATEAATENSTYHDFSISGVARETLPEELMPSDLGSIVLRTGEKRFRITVNSAGQLVTTEV